MLFKAYDGVTFDERDLTLKLSYKNWVLARKESQVSLMVDCMFNPFMHVVKSANIL